MKAEYDLINELGQKNWIDLAAGEAVMIGHATSNPLLVAEGTALAAIAREIKYHDDKFSLVEAMAISLIDKLEKTKAEGKTTIFIDDIFEGNVKNKPVDKWEYDLIFCGGRYEVRMNLPRYDQNTPVDNRKDVISRLVQKTYGNYDSYRVETETVDFKTQSFLTIKRFSENGNLVSRIVDFNHEGDTHRGWLEVYYFDEFSMASNAWSAVRKSYKGC